MRQQIEEDYYRHDYEQWDKAVDFMSHVYESLDHLFPAKRFAARSIRTPVTFDLEIIWSTT